ncbi:MAG: flagellar biosynthesis protein FlaG [Actinobacteria bacterium]|nr:flagellar biosynthesis protein FlaG [Actinomycetota bacterium]
MNIDGIEVDNRSSVNVTVDGISKASFLQERSTQTERDVGKSEGQNIKVTDAKLQQATKAMAKIAQAMNSHLNFSVDKSTGKTVVKIINGDTGEVIRQIPPEETLRIMSKMRDVIGLLFDREA